MAQTTFSGPVRSKNGFINLGPGATTNATLATDLTVANNAGRIFAIDPAVTPTALTIPAIVSTADSDIAGPGSDPNNANTIGTTFEILFKDNFTGTIKTASTNDKFVGSVMIGVDNGAKKAFVPATANNEVNLNGEAGAGNATTGGLKGSRIKFTAVAANLYMVEGLLIGDGTIATPFDTQ